MSPRLSQKFTLILLAVFGGGLLLSGIALFVALNRLAEAEVQQQAAIMMQTMNAVRSYTSDHIQPQLADELAVSDQFIPETVPAFSAREVFETVRSDENYATFFYKEAALNPTNPRDQADDFEAQILTAFRADPELEELSGFRDLAGQRVFYTARPLAISDEGCLACHSTPEVAPASLIATYGETGGFGWEVCEVVAAQIVYVPAGNVVDVARLFLTTVLVIVGLAFVAVVVAMNLTLRQAVIAPVTTIAGLAQEVADDAFTQEALEAPELEKVTQRSDELGRLAQTFRLMVREVYEREQRLREEVL
ncbi:MAG: DUF3365 domain-containing protein, partial [Anaerolineae bacterium]